MPTDATETRKAMKPGQAGAPPPSEPEHLPCPRCDSTNTKFCYYNNYNFSQPRHFCKSCRRYWTHGGTLRDIPVGGGSRKHAKRSRVSIASPAPPTAASAAGSTAFPSSLHDFRHLPAALGPIAADRGDALQFLGEAKICGGFTSLLSSAPENGLLDLGRFGLDIGTGLDDFGFELGRGFWPITGVVQGGPTSGNSNSSLAGNTWHLENGDGGFIGGGDCFPFPELAISTPGSFLK